MKGHSYYINEGRKTAYVIILKRKQANDEFSPNSVHVTSAMLISSVVSAFNCHFLWKISCYYQIVIEAESRTLMSTTGGVFKINIASCLLLTDIDEIFYCFVVVLAS